VGVYGIADPITTNQKAAGSSPAERATEISWFAGKMWSCSNGPGDDPGPFDRDLTVVQIGKLSEPILLFLASGLPGIDCKSKTA